MHQFLSSVASLVLTLAMGLVLIRKAADWGFIDIPDARKVHTLPTPRTGGLAMVIGGGLAFLLSFGLGFQGWPNLPWQTWLAGIGFMVVGALDDRYHFRPSQKFYFLLGLSVLAAWPWMQVVHGQALAWLPTVLATPWVAKLLLIPLLVLWFMAVPNAVNIEDAINGYMGGFTAIVLIFLLFRGVDGSIVIGAMAGFLLLNWPRARHFMGDTGSFGCGFFIAEGILRANGIGKPIIALALTAPIAMDVAMGLIRRKRLKMSFFTADRATCPHHLLKYFHGDPLWATPILWINAALFAWFSNSPWLTLAQAGLYGTALVYLNISYLRNRTNP
jgi:UDP-GlcNAc:undecaprenyl-phosphate GlcNAc-1-phosphate transferase